MSDPANSQTISIGAPSGTRKRYAYLDNMKWSLAILVILHHAAAIAGLDTFLVNLPRVEPSEQYQYNILDTFQSVNQGFFMSLFFFISAYFVIPSYERRGAWSFLKGKFKRLGIPILLTIVLIDPVAFYFAKDYAFFDAMRQALHLYGAMLESWNLTMGVTWFCWALIVFNVAYVIIRRCISHDDAAPTPPKPIPSTAKILLFAALMIPVDFLGLFLMNALGEDFLGFHLLKYFPMYIAMFCFGIQAYKNQWIDQLVFRHAFIWIVVWICAKVFLSPLSQMISRPFEVFGMSIFMLYSYKVLFNATSKWSKRLSRSAYAAYVIQIIPLCLIGKLYAPHMTQLPLLNFILISIPSVVVTFILAHFICKAPGLRRIF
jgi:glucans biosynthesis protein C